MKAFLATLLVVFIIDTTTGDTLRIFDYSSRVRSWDHARSACRRLGRGWDLVKIDNRREDNLIKTLLRRECSNNGGDGWFIGGKSTNGRWRWADGSRMTYIDFPRQSIGSVGIGRPSTVVNYAVIFKSDFQWGYVAPRPSPRMGYICEKRCGWWPGTHGGSDTVTDGGFDVEDVIVGGGFNTDPTVDPPSVGGFDFLTGGFDTGTTVGLPFSGGFIPNPGRFVGPV